MALTLPAGNEYRGNKATVYKLGVVKLANATEVLEAANNVAMTPADMAGGLVVNDGAVTDPSGSATLALGTATVLNTNIKSTDKIFLQRHGANASTTLGELDYTISAGVSFTINSLTVGTPGAVQTGDLSTVEYLIVHTV